MAGKVKLGAGLALDGEKEFKKAISDINKDISVLASEMGKTTEQFSRNADSMEALTAKSEGYTKKIEALKDKIEIIKSALENSTKEFGEADDKTKNWQISLNRAEAELAKTENALKDTTDKIDNFGKEADNSGDQVEKAGKKAKNSGDDAEKGESGWGKLGRGISKAGEFAAKAAAALGAAALGAAAGAFKLASDAGKAADELITMSNKTGISTKQLQEMQYASRFIDVELETMTGSMAKLTKSMDGARDGTGTQAEAFKRLGIQVKNTDGSLRDSKAVWAETIDALGKVANETDRDALSLNLFGKSAMELNPLIKAGSNELKRLGEEANKVGAVMGDDAVQQAGKFDDMMQTLQASAKGLASTVGVAVIPAITEIVGSLTTMIPAITEAIKTGDWEKAGTAITDTLNGLMGKITAALPGIITMASTIIGTLADTIVKAIPQILPPLIEAMILLLNTLVKTLSDNGPMLIKAGIDALMTLIDGIVESLPNLIDAAIAIILSLVEALLQRLPDLVNAAIKIIVALAQGLLKALPKLIQEIPKIVEAIVTAIVKNLPLLIEAAVQILVSLAAALIQNIPTLIMAIPKIIKAVFDAFKNVKWGDIGKNILSGIGDGIKNALKGLIESLGEVCGNIVKGVKGFFGIKSPSTIFAGIGKNMALGLGEGFTDAMSGVAKQINKSVPTSIAMNGTYSGNGYNSSGVYFNVPLNLDGRLITAATSRIQYVRNQGYARALGATT